MGAINSATSSTVNKAWAEAPSGEVARAHGPRLAELLTVRISEGRLPAGDRLPTQADLMKEFGVSRNSIREAISHLQERGLVVTHHGIGTFVAGPAERLGPLRDADPDDDGACLCELQLGIESEVVAMAAARRSAESLQAMRLALNEFEQAELLGADATLPEQRLHAEFGRACRSAHMRDLLARVVATLAPRWRLHLAGLQRADRLRHLRALHARYARIVSAIDAQDGDAAREAMRDLLASRTTASTPNHPLPG
ncbi:MAG: GntR family transcriptional regulator [Rhizobacter sp.]